MHYELIKYSQTKKCLKELSSVTFIMTIMACAYLKNYMYGTFLLLKFCLSVLTLCLKSGTSLSQGCHDHIIKKNYWKLGTFL